MLVLIPIYSCVRVTLWGSDCRVSWDEGRASLNPGALAGGERINQMLDVCTNRPRAQLPHERQWHSVKAGAIETRVGKVQWK